MKINGMELKVRDVVRLGDEKYMDATVIKHDHDAGTVTLMRPYVHTSSFDYTGGVIPYLGWEEFTVCDSAEFDVVYQEGD